jgi:hypothetical protein
LYKKNNLTNKIKTRKESVRFIKIIQYCRGYACPEKEE